MKVLIEPKPQSMFNALLLFFIIHSMQLGVGIQGFQRIVFIEARHDAWISVLISGAAAHAIGWVMVKTLALYPSADLYGIQYDVFGKWLGNALNLAFVVYWLFAFFIMIRNYMEVIQAWVFPDLPTWFMSLTLILLVAYGVSGGLRPIIGICFLSVILSLWIILLMGFPMQFTNWDYLFPIFESDIKQILKGAKKMTFTIIGFEIIYFVYPFIKEKEKAGLYMQSGLLFSNLLYLTIMLVSLAYFSGGQLERTVWGTLSLFKIVRMPFIERFEYVAITYWIILILPNLILFLWAASRGITRIWNRADRKVSIGFLLGLLLVLQIPMTRLEINLVNDYFAKAGFYIIFLYPILLWMAASMKNKFIKRRGNG
ncbi:GerAB/ArcD/ProY family transporter [Bacillus sp. REN3]|uniref:GerAB/ArcD/ProY family transporter n=1 Tax=Bacillus sp. REN3 TaxID=2802440 RepID=UPI001AEEF697|nr:GerAB/ArcD/ProY family transporter [Bacillus sp. REN3]